MKKLFATSLSLVFAFVLFAQAPQGISYQAIAFSAGGTPVANGNVGVRVSILDNSATGTVVYEETHIKTTNAQGLFNLNIGQGSATQGSFTGISWASNSKFLKVEIDPNGGTSYTTAGTNQLMSVPYALYSENTNASNLPSSGATTVSSKSGIMIVVYTSGYAYGFTTGSSGTPSWYSQTLSGTPIGAVATDSSIVIYTSGYAYGFTLGNTGTPGWYSQTLSGTVTGTSASGSTVVVYTPGYSYGFARGSGGTPSWYSQTLSGTPQGITVNGNNMIVVYTSGYAYGFTTGSGGTPSWYSQTLSGTPIGCGAVGKAIVVYTSGYAYGFARGSGGTPSWYSQTLSGAPVGISPE